MRSWEGMNSEVLGGVGKLPDLQNNGCCGRGTPRSVFYSHFFPQSIKRVQCGGSLGTNSGLPCQGFWSVDDFPLRKPARPGLPHQGVKEPDWARGTTAPWISSCRGKCWSESNNSTHSGRWIWGAPLFWSGKILPAEYASVGGGIKFKGSCWQQELVTWSFSKVPSDFMLQRMNSKPDSGSSSLGTGWVFPGWF